MAATYQTSTTGEDIASPATITVSPPSGLTTDDLWFVYVAWDCDNAGTSSATGFTQVGSNYRSTVDAFHSHALHWKNAGASESATDFTIASAGSVFGAKYISIRINGQNTTTPIDTSGFNTAASGASNVIDAPDVTVGSAGGLALMFAAMDTHTNGSPFTPPSGGTKLTDGPHASSDNPGISSAYQAVSAGSFAPGNWTFGGSDDGRCAATVIVASASGGGASAEKNFLTVIGAGA